MEEAVYGITRPGCDRKGVGIGKSNEDLILIQFSSIDIARGFGCLIQHL